MKQKTVEDGEEDAPQILINSFSVECIPYNLDMSDEQLQRVADANLKEEKKLERKTKKQQKQTEAATIVVKRTYNKKESKERKHCKNITVLRKTRGDTTEGVGKVVKEEEEEEVLTQQPVEEENTSDHIQRILIVLANDEVKRNIVIGSIVVGFSLGYLTKKYIIC